MTHALYNLQNERRVETILNLQITDIFSVQLFQFDKVER